MKEVRYLADSEAQRRGTDASLEVLIENCKALQALLGAWHDSVVQLQLLEDLPESPERKALRRAIARRRTSQLAAIRRAVAGDAFAMTPDRDPD